MKARLDWQLKRRIALEAISEMTAHPLWIRRRWLYLFGWPAALGALLLMLSAGFYFTAIAAEKLRLANARDSVVEFQKHGRRIERSPELLLTAFYRQFPDEKNLLPSIEKIFSMAKDHGISLERGEYKLTSDKQGRLMRFQMTFPIRGEYPKIRKYLDGLRTEIPASSLESLQLERQKVGEVAVDARIRLALYLGQES